MKEKTIRFSNVNDARRFIRKADKCSFDIDIFYNHLVLDGKSIMALMGIDLSKTVIVKYAGENPEFEDMLSGLQVG